MVQSNLLNKYTDIEHFFLDKEEMLNNAKFSQLKNKVYTLNQIHSDKIVHIQKLSDKKQFADALITKQKIFLGIYTADCLPILIYDAKDKTIAAVHAGWKGLLNGIIVNSLNYLKKIGADNKNVFIAIGPHIRKCCFEIPTELVNNFFTKYKYLNHKSKILTKKASHEFFSLSDVALSQLKYLSIPSQNIEIINICTYCDSKFYSYRRDHNKNGRMLSAIGLI